MAKISYAICGTGQGHYKQSLIIGEALKALGHQVIYTIINTLVTPVKNNILDLENTTITKLSKQEQEHYYFGLENFNFDLCLTDFEPCLPLMCKELNIPVVEISAQTKILYGPEIPEETNYIKLVRSIAPNAIRHIIPHFSGLNRHEQISFPPILNPEITRYKSYVVPRKVLVYLTHWEPPVIENIKQCLGFQFKIILAQDLPDYFEQFASCDFVICSGGHGIISDALYYHKPILCLPIEGHQEQEFNASLIDDLDLGMSTDLDLLISDLKRFLHHKSYYRENLQVFNLTSGTQDIINFLQTLPQLGGKSLEQPQ